MNVGRSLHFETDDAIVNSFANRARHIMQMLVLSIDASLRLRNSLNGDSSLGRFESTKSRESSWNADTATYIYSNT